MNKKKSRNKCLKCGKECRRHQYKFCSNKCFSEFNSNKAVNSGTATTPTMRKYLLKVAGHKCKICGLIEWKGRPIPLVTDHEDGNSSNSSILNMRLICPNCDALLPTYKGRNRGKGRWSRKMRYQQGKSY